MWGNTLLVTLSDAAVFLHSEAVLTSELFMQKPTSPGHVLTKIVYGGSKFRSRWVRKKSNEEDESGEVGGNEELTKIG